MRRATALLAVAALFVVGVLVGVLATHAFYAHRLHQPGGLAAIGVGFLGSSLERELDLDAEQRRQVEAILGDMRGELREVRRDVVPRLYAIRDRAFDRVHQVLTPQQQARLQRSRVEHARRVERLVGPW